MVLYLPLRYVYRRALITGESWLWSSAFFGGFYLHGEGQVGAWHPAHLILYRFLSLASAFNLELMSNYIIAFFGMFVFLYRRLVLSSSAALLGALLFAFSGFNLLHANHINIIAVAAHIPWLLTFVDMLLTGKARRSRYIGFIGVALATASQLLLGHPQFVWITWVAIALFVTFLAHHITRFNWLIIALAIGVSIGAIQIWPTLDALRHSVRVSQGISFQTGFSLHPFNIIQLWAPYAFNGRVYASANEFVLHELGIYPGSFALVSLAWLAARRPIDGRRDIVLACILLILASLLLALGRFGGLAYVVANLPVIGAFRAPVRYIVLCHLGLAALSAVAFNDMLQFTVQASPSRKRILWSVVTPTLLAIVTALALLALKHLAAHRSDAFIAHDSLVLIGPFLIGAMSLLVGLLALGWRPAAYILPIVIAGDLGAWGHTYIWRETPLTLKAVASLANVPPHGVQGERVFAPVPPTTATLAVFRGFSLTSGYVALWPASVLPDDDEASARLRGARWRFVQNSWKPIEHPIPRARLLTDVRRSHDLVGDTRVIDILKTGLVEVELPRLDGDLGYVTVHRDVAGAMDLTVTAPGRQLLTTTERFHDGWRVTVDGHAEPLMRVYGGYLGCLVGPGVHRVELRFEPLSAIGGAALTAIGAALLLLSSFIVARRV